MVIRNLKPYVGADLIVVRTITFDNLTYGRFQDEGPFLGTS